MRAPTDTVLTPTRRSAARCISPALTCSLFHAAIPVVRVRKGSYTDCNAEVRPATQLAIIGVKKGIFVELPGRSAAQTRMDLMQPARLILEAWGSVHGRLS